jgi:hypothetical protein
MALTATSLPILGIAIILTVLFFLFFLLSLCLGRLYKRRHARRHRPTLPVSFRVRRMFVPFRAASIHTDGEGGWGRDGEGMNSTRLPERAYRSGRRVKRGAWSQETLVEEGRRG